MTIEATLKKDCARDRQDLVLVAAHGAGEIIQCADGQAGYVAQLTAPSAGDRVTIQKTGNIQVPKTASIVILDGGEVYWDHSANAAHFKKANDRDFYLGTAVGEAASSDTTMLVNLNNKPEYLIDCARDPITTAIVLTAGTPSLAQRGGKHVLAFSATAEAQKIDVLSDDAWALGANGVVRTIVNVVDNGDADSGDLFVGAANATHASDHDSITESIGVSLNLDDGTLNILAESDDGTTEVAATDTTVDYVVGTPFEVWIDTSTPSACRIFIDGVRVLSGSTFDISAATGPLKLLAHLEKGANDTPGEVHINRLQVRTREQN